MEKGLLHMIAYFIIGKTLKKIRINVRKRLHLIFDYTQPDIHQTSDIKHSKIHPIFGTWTCPSIQKDFEKPW